MLKVSLLLLALASVQAAEPSPLKSNFTWGALFEGILDGLQYNPNSETGCVRDFNKSMDYVGKAVGLFYDIAANLDLMYAFDTVAAFQVAFASLDSAVDRCRLPDLTATIINLPTTTGFAALAARLGTKYEYILSRWFDIFNKLDNDTVNAGIDIGEILSVVLNYKI